MKNQFETRQDGGETRRNKSGKDSNTSHKGSTKVYASSTRTLACELVTLTPRTRAFSRMVTRLRAETVDAISAAKLCELGRGRGGGGRFEFGFGCGKERKSRYQRAKNKVSLPLESPL